MDVVIIFNGLANQMSQYAFFLKKKDICHSTQYITINNDHNGYELDKVFNIPNPSPIINKTLYYCYRFLSRIHNSQKFNWISNLLNPIIRIKKEDYNYDYKESNLRRTFGVTFWEGGWHSEEYFIDIKNKLSQIYTFKKISDKSNNNILKLIKSTNSVAVHIRRGDYLKNNNYKLFGNIATDEYYEKAMKYINEKIESPLFFIFTNDIKWVKNNIKGSNIFIVENNQKEDSWKDLYLMTECKNIILANSSFSWWGAWLNENNKNVIIRPSKFINTPKGNNIFPERWTLIN